MKGKFDYEYRQFPNDVLYDLRKRDCIINTLNYEMQSFRVFRTKTDRNYISHMHTDVEMYICAMSVLSGCGVNLYLRKFRVTFKFQGRNP